MTWQCGVVDASHKLLYIIITSGVPRLLDRVPTLPCRPIMIVFTSGWRVTTKARDQILLAGDLSEYVAVLR